MTLRGVSKNFTYGELWKSEPRKSSTSHREMEKVAAYKITSNAIFLNYLHDNGYEVFLDSHHQSYAYTDVTNKRIVLNSNYPDSMLESFLKHELGHLLLFNVNQFTTVRNDTMRSIIAKELYTPERARKWNFRKLLLVENIIQDIVIETLSNGKCVCHSMLELEGTNAGVKHLSELESVGFIAREVCDNLLPNRDEADSEDNEGAIDFPSGNGLKSLLEALEGMLKDLKADMEEVEAAIQAEDKKDYLGQLERSRRVKEQKLKKQIGQIDALEERKGEISPTLEAGRERLKEELEKLEKSTAEDAIKAEERRARATRILKKKLERARELADLLEDELEATEEASRTGEGEGGPGKGSGEGAASRSSTTSEGSDGGEVDQEISVNETDHLLGDPDGQGGNSHSFDCGYPTPLTITRDEAARRGNVVTVIDSSKKVNKIVIHDDSFDYQTKGRNKVPESEHTYYKSNKKEYDETDMIRGKRKLRMSGVNVLVGLDISGSMTTEWGTMFTEMSDFVKNLKEGLDIENIYYFTYHHNLADWSEDVNALNIRASGGNAFGYVYQQVMQNVPILTRNEIILVTDCGDNLGFNLESVCDVSRNGENVENHISIIDTEGSGFYMKEQFDEKSWSLYNMHDADLYRNIKANIERLIER